MTVNTTNITSGPYVGNGISDTFSYTFRVTDKTQLKVFETDTSGVRTELTVDTDYTVADIGEDNGGIITRVAGALPLNYTWYIRSDYKQTQKTAIGSQGPFFPDIHEDALDKLTFLIQQLEDITGRTVRLSEEIDIDGDLTIDKDATDRATTVLAFDANGDIVLLDQTTVNTISAVLSQTVTLVDGQTSVTFTSSVENASFYISGNLADNGRLTESTDYTVNITTDVLTLTESYPAGTLITLVYNDTGSSALTGFRQDFGSVAQLKASSLSTGLTVTTQGYYTADDGGHAEYYIKSSGDYGGTPDEYGDHTLANGNVAVLQYTDEVNVAQFGANGVFGTDQTPYIQAAIDYVSTYTYPPVVRLNSELYKVTAPLVVASDRVKIKGSGSGSSRLWRNTDYGDTVRFSFPSATESIDNIEISGLTIEHSIATVGMTSGSHINVVGANRCVISDINLIYPYRGILIQGGVDYDIDNISILGTYVSADPIRQGLVGIQLTEAPAGHGSTVVNLATRVRMSKIHSGGALLAAFQYNLLLEAYEEVQLNQFHFAHGQYNISFNQSTKDKPMLDFFASDGYLDACALDNVLMTGASATGDYYIGETLFSNVEFKSGGFANRGIVVDGTARAGTHTQAVQGLKLSNVTISAHKQHGALFNGGKNIELTGFNAKGNSTSGSGSYDGIQVGAAVESINITGGSSGKTTESASPGLQRYGINLISGCTEVTINGVNVRGNQTASILDNSKSFDNYIHGNTGYNPGIISPSPSIPASTVDFTNPSGHDCYVSIFGGTVSNVKLDGQTITGATGIKFPVPAGSVVQMTYSVAPSWIWWRQ